MGDNTLLTWSIGVAVVFAVCGGLGLACYLVWLVWREPEFMRDLFRAQVRAIIGVPLAAFTAFCVVSLLEATYGPIKFGFVGFSFEGASGPVVLWVLCFIAVVVGIVSLWRSEGP